VYRDVALTLCDTQRRPA